MFNFNTHLHICKNLKEEIEEKKKRENTVKEKIPNCKARK